MERLRLLLSQIGAQLGVLTISQRIAIGLCAALVAGSLLWLMQWSTTPEMVPLVKQDFSFEQLDNAEKALGGIRHERRGMRLYVRPADKHNALRLAHQADALPEGSLFDMESVVTDTNPFQAPDARAFAHNYAKGNELAKIISTSPVVAKASVMLNPVTKRRLGGTSDVPTASVTVTLVSGTEMTHEIVQGFARLVAGAVGGLKAFNVNIIDARTLRSYSLPDPEDAAGFDLLSMLKQREEHYRAKILSKLADIPGVQVAVTVELDMSKRVTQNVKHDLPQPKVETSSSTEQSSAAQSAEPGVQANLGQALSETSPGQTRSTEKTSVEHFAPNISLTETIEHLPFATKKVTAAIGIPRSFILNVLRSQKPDATEDPKDDDPAFMTVRDAQVARVRASVERIVMAKTADDVEVDVYPDMEWTSAGAVWSGTRAGAALAQQGVEGFDTFELVRTYGPQVGLATLAMVSLIMMMRMVRKSSELFVPHRRPGSELSELAEGEEPMLTVGQAPVGQAEASGSLLTGKEVDPETLRSQELGREVSKLVERNPAGAADLINRWVQDGT